MLDTAEYIHLALHASGKGDTHAAMNYLKEALQNEPGNAVAHYLLAAEHAEIGLYDRAISGMEEALRLEPGIEIARFQLGLLYLQTQHPDQALQTFTALAEHTQDRTLATFSQAYQLLIRDEDAQGASALLREGIADCSNEYLRNDMQRVLESLQGVGTSGTAPTAAPEKPAANAFILDAYRDSLDSH